MFQSYTPLVEGISLDEAFLDVTGATTLFGDGPAIGRDIRRRVREELRLSCGLGVAANKLLAIMKDGQFHKQPDFAGAAQRQVA